MTLTNRYKTKKDDQAKAKPGGNLRNVPRAKPGTNHRAKPGAKTGVKPREQQNFIDRDDSGNSNWGMEGCKCLS